MSGTKSAAQVLFENDTICCQCRHAGDPWPTTRCNEDCILMSDLIDDQTIALSKEMVDAAVIAAALVKAKACGCGGQERPPPECCFDAECVCAGIARKMLSRDPGEPIDRFALLSPSPEQ